MNNTIRIDKKELVTIETAIAVSNILRNKIQEICIKIMKKYKDDNLCIVRNMVTFTKIPPMYVSRSEVDLARKKYTDAITPKTIGILSLDKVMKIAELKQEVASTEFKERLGMSIECEKFLNNEMSFVLSNKSSDEVKVTAARNCINEAEDYMTVNQKLSCLRAIILFGNDSYAKKWKREAVALSNIVMREKFKIEQFISSCQEPRPEKRCVNEEIVEISSKD